MNPCVIRVLNKQKLGGIIVPRIECRSIDESIIRKVSTDLTTELAECLDITRDRFSYAMVSGDLIVDGEKVQSVPYIKVFWFTRPAELRQVAADIISKHFQKAGVEKMTVYFDDLGRDRTFKYNCS